MSLQGARELRARFKAVKTVFKPLGRQWQDATIPLEKAAIPVRTGKTRASIRRGSATVRRATVVGSYVTNFLDAGTKAHDETPKRAKVIAWGGSGNRHTFFAKKVHKRATAGSHFKKRAAAEGFAKVDALGELVRQWNRQ